ncbi:MAG: DUF937 domain-containing protein [Pseudomonadota bacterium]
MSLKDMLAQLQQGGGIEKLAAQVGLDAATARSLADMVGPAIGTAAKRRAEAGQLEQVLQPLRGEDKTAYFEAPERAAEPAAQAEGMAFLDQLLGSREATERLTAAAAERAGAEQEKASAFLPGLAAALQGGMQRETPDNSIDDLLSGLMGGGGSGAGSSSGGGILGMVTGLLGGGAKNGAGQQGSPLGPLLQMLDRDGDGSPLDDVLDMVMKR